MNWNSFILGVLATIVFLIFWMMAAGVDFSSTCK